MVARHPVVSRYQRSAYVDTSALVAMALREPSAAAVARRLASFHLLVSSNLLEAEMRSALAREDSGFGASLLSRIRWVMPTRPLSPEIAAALRVGYLRGADLWHIASALYAARTMPELVFITLDRRQENIAAGLGFAT